MAIDPKQVQAAFLEVVAAEPADRAGALNRVCAGDADLCRQVELLLHAHDDSRGLPEAGGGAERTGAYIPRELPGVVIAGRYKLLEEIGEGGMGTVWVAEQTQPVRRKVALKLIKAGMDSKSVLARFEAERQALAVMDHPNIAKVLDGGLTEAGRPFFVMEYVKGVPITEYCDATRLTVNERLQLFVQVCQAVQHAHQKGIIHRDLKPSNILVAPYDDKPVPKVIDFGLAKAMHQSLTEKTLHTAHEAVLGTPLYMSPEQAQLNNLDVDTRSDIYSLGVLLYELLTGTTPLEKQRFKEAAWDEIKRIIREEEPPRPSTRLSSSNTLPSLAAGRQIEPARLTKLVRGELDWIVMKSLEKDRTRRYDTANGFAADVLRYLSGEAIQAHPPSRTYRLKKFVRRNKGQVLAAGLVFFALLAGVIGTGIGLIRANHSAENERLAKIDAEEKREKAEIAEQRERERAEGERMAKERESAQRARAEKAYARTADVLDTMVSEVTGNSLATQKAITPEQKKFLNEVLTYYQEFAGEKADDEKTLLRTAQAAFRVGAIEYRLGRKEEAAAAGRKACAAFEALAAKYPAVSKHRQDLATCRSNLGISLLDLKKPVEAAEQQRKALALRETLAAEFPTDPEIRSHLADSYGNVGSLLIDLEKKAESEEQQRKGLALRLKLAADYPANPRGRHEVAIARSNLGVLLDSMGKRADAGEQHRQALALREKLAAESPDKPEYRQELAKVHINLGLNLAALWKHAEAEANCRKALEIQTKLAAEFPADPAYRQVLARGHINMSTLLKVQGQRKEAEEHCRKGLTILENLAADFPADPVYRKESVSSCQALGRLLAAQQQYPEAEEQFRKGLAVAEKLVADFAGEPEYRQDEANANTILGMHLQGLGKFPEAERCYRKALAIQEKYAVDFPNSHENSFGLGGSYCNIGNMTRDGGNPSESLPWFDKAIAVLTSISGQESRVNDVRLYLRNSYGGRAVARSQLKQFAEAIPDWDKAIDLSSKEQLIWFRLQRVDARHRAGQAAEAVAEVAELVKSSFWRADQWYDFACVYALASSKIADKKQVYADRAMELLQQAVRAGYKNAAHMKQDTDLVALHSREDFKKLVAEVEAKAEKTKP